MILKANELRIGNYLNGKQGHVIITEIRENNIVKIHDNTSIFHVGTCLKPIPLTEEWLFKFGFEKKYKSYEKCDFTFLQGGFDKLAYKLTIIENTPKYVH